jgi:diguanylate cyclase (GGDEF)-like protein
VDADPEDPADFGEEVLVTDALRSAAKGTAKVDDEPAQDEWGNFYSSYSPVFDSYGNITGIVGVDFDADWYDKQITDNSISIGIMAVISFFVTLTVLLIVTGNIRKKLGALNADLSVLASDVEELAADLGDDSGYKMKVENAQRETSKYEEYEFEGDLSAADIEALSGRIRSMHTDIKTYLDFVHEKALTDALTDIGNTTAYMERILALDEAISDGRADFHVVLFDINYLKYLNDEYGHMCGDRAIRGAAEVIAKVFGKDNSYRIGGDEFIAIVEGTTDDELAEKLSRLDEEIALYNEANRELDGDLSLSNGQAAYKPGEDRTYKNVFSRADQEMYANKSEFHKAHTSGH